MTPTTYLSIPSNRVGQPTHHRMAGQFRRCGCRIIGEWSEFVASCRVHWLGIGGGNRLPEAPPDEDDDLEGPALPPLPQAPPKCRRCEDAGEVHAGVGWNGWLLLEVCPLCKVNPAAGSTAS